jgi:hypothetical protein
MVWVNRLKSDPLALRRAAWSVSVGEPAVDGTSSAQKQT